MKWDKPYPYPAEIDRHLEYPSETLLHAFIRNATRNPHKTATVFMGKKTSYKTLLGDAYRVARHLQGIGIKAGDRVSVALPNCPQYVSSYYGVLMLGAIVVQTNPLYTEREMVHQFNDSGAKAVIAIDLLYNRLLQVKPQTNVEHMVFTSIKDALPFPLSLLYPLTEKLPRITETDRIHAWKRVLAAPKEPLPFEQAKPEDVAVLQYTGGTTGTPKGVMLTHRNLLANTWQIRAWFYKARTEKEVILAAVPFFHVYGMTTSMNYPLLIGATMVLAPRFEPKNILKLIEKERVTVFPGAPTMYIGLLHHRDIKKHDISSIEACISGSAALPLEVQTRFEALTQGKLVEGYGLSEASPVTHCNPVWGERINGSIGLPLPDTEMRLIDWETGEEVPTGEKGELLVRGPQVMKGYWNNPKETDNVLKDGWLHTGDIAYQDEKGFTYIVDRKKEMIIASGFNIYPREIEEILYQHPSIQEASVIGVPDDYRGETVKAYIVLREGQHATEKELDTYCRSLLASYKVPRHYEFRTELPKSLVGKVLKRELKEE